MARKRAAWIVSTMSEEKKDRLANAVLNVFLQVEEELKRPEPDPPPKHIITIDTRRRL